jgi:Domain of unknown function (DUF4129)
VASGTFEKDSVDWWIQQRQQQAGEWLESLVSGFRGNGQANDPWALPDWFLQGFFWLVIIGLVAGASWQLYKMVQPYLDSYFKGGQERSPQPTIQPILTAAEWLSRSRLAQQQGDYREACRSLYFSALCLLSDRNQIRQEISRTDGEYLKLVLMIKQNQPYELLIRTHEQLCFSDEAISADLFNRCWRAYQEIEKP